MAGEMTQQTNTEESQLSVVRGQSQRTTNYGLRTLQRVLRLWKLYTIMDFTFVAADLRLAVVYFISDFISHFAGITAMLLLAERFAGIGAWSRDQVLFMLGYGVHRFLNEMLRTDTDPVAFGLTLSQNVSLVVLAVALLLGLWVRHRPARPSGAQPTPLPA